MRLAEASSASVPYSPFSSICCQRCAHAKAFRVPSGWGLVAGHDRAAVAGNDTLAAAAAGETHGDAHDQGAAVECSLCAHSHAAAGRSSAPPSGPEVKWASLPSVGYRVPIGDLLRLTRVRPAPWQLGNGPTCSLDMDSGKLRDYLLPPVGGRSLNRWAGLRAVRAEDAAVARYRMKQRAAALTVVEELTGVGRHGFRFRMAAMRAGNCRLELSHALYLCASAYAAMPRKKTRAGIKI